MPSKHLLPSQLTLTTTNQHTLKLKHHFHANILLTGQKITGLYQRQRENIAQSLLPSSCSSREKHANHLQPKHCSLCPAWPYWFPANSAWFEKPVRSSQPGVSQLWAITVYFSLFQPSPPGRSWVVDLQTMAIDWIFGHDQISMVHLGRIKNKQNRTMSGSFQLALLAKQAIPDWEITFSSSILERRVRGITFQWL